MRESGGNGAIDQCRRRIPGNAREPFAANHPVHGAGGGDRNQTQVGTLTREPAKEGHWVGNGIDQPDGGSGGLLSRPVGTYTATWALRHVERVAVRERTSEPDGGRSLVNPNLLLFSHIRREAGAGVWRKKRCHPAQGSIQECPKRDS